ncbi:hypothetical protein K443DRAFT_492619 [Laccaria amethystina LaAM-08-1]|uniref:Uncharacterized protein n=1 Tax=Laccaria amethystina LaAM-08-1 TaxID=1095629 RepID=A0A0C9X109_9AGAR|nr:hypothetical protein K443DRAFT_492619 [Laccaria amethystina LaAM-08-1]
MQLALLKSQCTLSHTHFLLSKPTVNETLTLDDSFVPQPSAAATRLLPRNPNFPSTAYPRLRNPTTLLILPLPSWITSIIGKAFQTLRFHGGLASVRCKSDGAGILDMTRFSSCSMSTSGYRGQGSDESSSMGKEGDCRAARVER